MGRRATPLGQAVIDVCSGTGYISQVKAVLEHPIILGERGRMVLPAPIREQLELHGGERFLARVERDGSIRLISYRSIAEHGRGLFARLAPNRSLVDELIAERRGDAAREAAS